MELLLLYFWLKLDAIIGLFSGLTYLTAVLGVAGWMWSSSSDTYTEDATRRKIWLPIFLWKVVPVFVVFGLISLAIPNRTETAVLVGGHYALRVVNTPEAEKVMSVMRKKANEILDKELAK